MTCQGGSFTRDSFHQVTIRDDAINIGLDQLMPRLVEFRREMRRRHGHAHPLTKSLPQWTRGDFHARGQPVFRMTRRLAVKLSEFFDLLQREVVSREV